MADHLRPQFIGCPFFWQNLLRLPLPHEHGYGTCPMALETSRLASQNCSEVDAKPIPLLAGTHRQSRKHDSCPKGAPQEHSCSIALVGCFIPDNPALSSRCIS